MRDETMAILGAWIAAGLTLAMYTFLYGDNPIFKAAEHLYVGVGVGYLISQSIFQYLVPKLWEPLFERGEWARLMPFALGFLILTRLVPNWSWLSRWSFAAIMGITAGLFIPSTINTDLMPQVADTVQPIYQPAAPDVAAADPGAKAHAARAAFGLRQINNLLVLIGVLGVLVYFFYSVEHRGPVKWAARLGIIFLMVAFGAMFGNTTMGRMSLLVDRVQSLIDVSGRRHYFATPILLVAIVGILTFWVWTHRSREAAAPPRGPAPRQ